MLSDSNSITAREIAIAIGFRNAADVTPRLNALHTEGVISKERINKRVYWGIVQDSGRNTGEGQYTSPDETANRPSPIQQHAIYEKQERTDLNGGEPDVVDALLFTIENLKSEIQFLRDLTQSLLAGKCTVNANGELYSNDGGDFGGTAPPACEANTNAPTIQSVPSECDDKSISDHPTTFAFETPHIPEEGFTTPRRSVAQPPARSWEPEPITTSNRFELLSHAGDDDDSETEDATMPTGSGLNRHADHDEPLPATRDRRGTDVTATPPRSRSASNRREAPIDHNEPVSTDVESSAVEASEAADASPGHPTNIHPRVRMKKPLVAVVGDSMVKRMSSYELHNLLGDDINAFVRPFVGATIEEMKSYIEPIIQKKPDVIILHIGTNDLSIPSGDGEQSILNNLHELLTKIGDALPNAIIVLSYPTCRRDSYNGRVRIYKNMLLEYCRQNLIFFYERKH